MNNNNNEPIRLPVSSFVKSPPMTTKIKRGGMGGSSNSGDRPRRFYTANRMIRQTTTGKQLPWPARGNAIWDPLDPFIIALRTRKGE